MLDKFLFTCYNVDVNERREHMRFTGYKVGNKKFGCGQRKEAEEESKRTGLPIVYWHYSI